MSEILHPLQTRAVWLTPDRLESPSLLKTALKEFRERSYNTIILPVLYDGEVSFQCQAEGGIKAKRCPGVRALEMLAESDFTVWLSIDPLSGGAPGSRSLGTLARHNRQWLMKNVEGNFRVKAGREELPGLFCWTSLQFRRFTGNLVNSLVEAYPVDGLVFDLRHVPRTTHNPSTWTHLGYSCLRWIQDELEVDLERFLSRPSVERLEKIDGMRQKKLMVFLENIIARARLLGGAMTTHILASLGNPEDPWAPWLPIHEEGVVDEVLLLSDGETLPHHVKALDLMTSSPKPLLAAIATETDLADLAKGLKEVSALGFAVLKPGPLGRTTMPETENQWESLSALEADVPTALRIMVEGLREERSRMPALEALLAETPAGMLDDAEEPAPQAALMEFRKKALRLVRLLRKAPPQREEAPEEEEQYSAGTDLGSAGEEERRALANRLERVARLILLNPVPVQLVQ